MVQRYTANGLTIIFHQPSVSCHFDSYTVVEPSVSQSGNWEVWNTEAEGSDEVSSIEEVEFVPESRLIELVETVEPSELDMFAVHAAVAGFLMGKECGSEDAKRDYQNMARFALGSLTGEIAGGDLEDAADEYYYRLSNKGAE